MSAAETRSELIAAARRELVMMAARFELNTTQLPLWALLEKIEGAPVTLTPAELQALGWRPITSAPIGEIITVLCPSDDGPFVAHMARFTGPLFEPLDSWFWLGRDGITGVHHSNYPTHWHPDPDPPGAIVSATSPEVAERKARMVGKIVTALDQLLAARANAAVANYKEGRHAAFPSELNEDAGTLRAALILMIQTLAGVKS